MKILKAVKRGGQYLVSRVDKNGLCLEFHKLRHGPSHAWTTACIGSALWELGIFLPQMLEAILNLRTPSGGWAYNPNALPDADTTLRVIQYLQKIRFSEHRIIEEAEAFVALHQDKNGGIATFRPGTLTDMGYSEGRGWSEPHPCVTALAAHVLSNGPVRSGAASYVSVCLKQSDARAYWWQTPWYVRYEFGAINGESIGNDPVEIALALLLKAKLGIPDKELTARLVGLQLNDGSFPTSHQFRIPRPGQSIDDITEQEETVPDQTRIFSTAAASVALLRQQALLERRFGSCF